MYKYIVEYHDMPFAHSQPRILIVEAKSRVAAFVVAFVALTERGFCIDIDMPGVDYHAYFLPAEVNELEQQYVIPPRRYGQTRITNVEVFHTGMKELPGKVLHG